MQRIIWLKNKNTSKYIHIVNDIKVVHGSGAEFRTRLPVGLYVRTMATTAEAVAAAAGGEDASRVLPTGITPPQQQQMPAGISTGFDADLEAPAAPSGTPSITTLVAFLVRQQTQMADMMITFKTSGRDHMANAKLDDRNFKRIEKFNNKRETWTKMEDALHDLRQGARHIFC